jgi:D-lactate dehydrogenase
MGNCLMAGQGQAPARQAARKAGLHDSVGAVTLSKMCGSGMRALMFAHDMLLPRLQVKQKKQKITFHPVCSVYKMGLMGKIEAVGRACADEVHIPALAGCCGMAGDRGFYYPELTKAATHIEAAEIKQQSFEGYYTSAQTCAINFSEAVGQHYKSMLHLLDEVS